MPPIGPFDRPIPVDALRKVAAVTPRLEIRDIRLVGLSCTLMRQPPAKAQALIALSHEVALDKPEHKNYVGVRVTFSLHAKAQLDADSEPQEYLKIVATFLSVYEMQSDEPIPDDGLSAFAEVNAVHTAWPYLRELVHSVSGRMGVPPMTVPLLKIRQVQPKAEDSGRPAAEGRDSESE